MNETQIKAHAMLSVALGTLSIVAEIEPAGEGGTQAYDGASVGFDNARTESARIVHVYQDDDGAWMVDAMDADIGIPAPQPYTAGRLLAYLVWAQGDDDDAFEALAQAATPIAR